MDPRRLAVIFISVGLWLMIGAGITALLEFTAEATGIDYYGR